MKPITVSATKAKNQFASVLERAVQGERIVITRHDVPKAVLLSLDAYNALVDSPARQLNALSEEFDALLDGMQSPQVQAGLKEAFDAPPVKLGRAAVAAARKRG